jgi:aconitate hydratase
MSAFNDTRRELELANGQTVHYYSLAAFAAKHGVELDAFPYSLRILLEQLLRQQTHPAFTEEHVAKLAAWTPEGPREEFPLMPARVLLQDFTGVPCIVDLAVLRSEMARMGCDPDQIEPSIPVDLVIDHSLQVESAGCATAMDSNMEIEFKRNDERYAFLKWGQKAFDTLNVIPPGVGICHQVNMEMLASCVATSEQDGVSVAFPDSVVGTDSHTPTINSMGVLGWGVGGIEAEAAMLGQPIPILSPIVTGVRLTGALQPSVTATDAALAVVSMLREYGVVGHFVEFFGEGLDSLTLADRAPLANMAPEYGATMGFFPVDDATLNYLRNTGRSEEQIDLVERYCKAQGLFRDDTRQTTYSHVLELDLSGVQASVAGPKRPQDRVWIGDLQHSFHQTLTIPQEERGFGLAPDAVPPSIDLPGKGTLTHGSVVIAAITSCTNTSNPSLLLSAGIMARKAVARGLTVPGFVKTSFAPGSRIAGEFLAKTNLQASLDALGFQIVGYGCTTCIGNSGPLAADVTAAIEEHDLIAGAVLSGNRNFEGRVHALTQANYLCSPPLVVAYALAGTVDINLTTAPIGTGSDGQPVYLSDIWATPEEIEALIATADDPALYKKLYGNTYAASPVWSRLPADSGSVYAWNADSTYIKEPAWVDGAATPPAPLTDVVDAAILGMFGDFVTTDHISPAGAIKTDSPAGEYLIAHGVRPADFNSFGARRGNHEVMVRGTFGNIRLRNQLVDVQGGYTRYHPTGEVTSIYDAAMRYASTQTPLVVLTGKMYGAGSSRDWAAKGPSLLGIRAVIAESYERIHRSNLVGMGIMPLEYLDGQTAASLGLTGKEAITITGIATATPGCILQVTARGATTQSFDVLCRIDSPVELDYYRNGGILRYVLRRAAGVATD